MAVFFSFPFFQGKLKIYYLPLAIVIASAMAASLLVSFTLVPALSPRLLEKREKGRRVEEKRASRFEKALGVLIRHPVEVLLVVAALLFGSYKWFRAEVTMGRWYSLVLEGSPLRPGRHAAGDRHRPDRRDDPGLRREGRGPGL